MSGRELAERKLNTQQGQVTRPGGYTPLQPTSGFMSPMSVGNDNIKIKENVFPLKTVETEGMLSAKYKPQGS